MTKPRSLLVVLSLLMLSGGLFLFSTPATAPRTRLSPPAAPGALPAESASDVRAAEAQAAERVPLAGLNASGEEHTQMIRVEGRIVLPPDTSEENLAAVIGSEVLLRSRLYLGPEERRWVKRTARVKPDLSFAFDRVPGDAYASILCTAPPFMQASTTDLELLPDGNKRCTLSLAIASSLSGKAVDGDGQPLRQIPVTLRCSSPDDQRNVLTDDDGRFVFRDVDPGNMSVTARTRSAILRWGPRDVKSGEVVDDIILAPGAAETIKGRVVWDDGSPAENALVTIAAGTKSGRERIRPNSPFVRADADGRFELAKLAGGAPSLLVSAIHRQTELGPRKTWYARRDHILPGEFISLVLSPGAMLRGRVVDDTGAPLKSFFLGAEWRDWDAAHSGVSDEVFEDEEGYFQIGPLRPGRWAVTAGRKWPDESEAVVVRVPGQVLVIVPRATIFTGLVLEPTGAPAPEASVSLYGRTPSRRFQSCIETVEVDEKGRFRFEEVIGGEVYLVAESEQNQPSDKVVLLSIPADHHTGLVLRLALGGTLTGVVAGYPPIEETISLWRRETMISPGRELSDTPTDEQGSFRFEGLATGTYKLTTWSDGHFALRATVEVIAGQTIHVVLD